MKAHRVTVLGREIPVRSTASDDTIRKIEAFVNTRIESISSRLTTADPQLVITLALLNLAESYLELVSQQAETPEVEARVKKILHKLDSALDAHCLFRET